MLDTVARAPLEMRRSGAGARVRDKNPKVVVRYVTSGSSSAVLDNVALDEPVRVAQGLLARKSKHKNMELRYHCLFENSHVSICT